MFGSKEQLIPINQAATEELKFYTRFPGWVPVDQIGINVTRIHRLTHLAGIKTLVVLGENNLETSSFIPMITGVNPEGSALASFGAVQSKIDTHQDQSFEGDSHLIHYKRWHMAWVRLNNAEITQRIRNNDRFNGNTRSPEAWSFYLNQAIKHGIENTGTNFLIKGLDKEDWLTLLSVEGLVIPSLASVTVILSHLSSQLTQPEFIQSFMYMYASIYAGSRSMGLVSELSDLISTPHKHTNRFSLLPGPQIDRALVLKLYSMFSGPVVKPLASKA